MVIGSDSALNNPSRKPEGRTAARIFRRSATLIIVLTIAIFGLLEAISHRRPPAPMTLTAAEVRTEDAHLEQLGLTVGDGSFLREHPLAQPWASCSLLPSNRFAEPDLVEILLGSRRVRANLLHAELDVLQPIMERAYGGPDIAAEPGWNGNQWFANWQ